MTDQTTESIIILMKGYQRTVTRELALRRLFNRAIEMSLNPRIRYRISQVTQGFIDVSNVLLAHYREAHIADISNRFPEQSERGRQISLFMDSMSSFLPWEWKRTIDRIVNQLSNIFFLYTNTLAGEGIDRDTWAAGWTTDVIPQIVQLAESYDISLLDDPTHPDFVTANTLFAVEMQRIGFTGAVNLARQPARSVEYPDTEIEYRLVTPHGLFIVDLITERVRLLPRAEWDAFGTWDLWPIYAEEKGEQQ